LKIREASAENRGDLLAAAAELLNLQAGQTVEPDKSTSSKS